MNQPLRPPATPTPNWWTRNWKWFVPAGCLTVALLSVVFVGSILLVVFSAMKSTDVYKDALSRAKADPAVIEALGSPVKDGLLVSGNANVNGASGESNLAIPISGPKGKGQFTSRQKSHLASGIIPGSSWRSDKRINVSIFSRVWRRPVHLDRSDANRTEKTFG
jgi:Cytochrome oxidase complex assembly protein 1